MTKCPGKHLCLVFSLIELEKNPHNFYIREIHQIHEEQRETAHLLLKTCVAKFQS